MGQSERPSLTGAPEPLGREELLPDHFYAAYVFDRAETRRPDVTAVIGHAQRLGYSMRSWWLSQAADIGDEPDRLIVCVHHASGGENAGMDLYEMLSEQQVLWDDLEAAALEEYRDLGQPLQSVEGIRKPVGTLLFPSAVVPESGPAAETENRFLVYYSLSGYMLLAAADAKAASEAAFGLLHALVGNGEAEGLSTREASQIRFSDLDVAIDTVEAIEFPPNNQL